MSGERAGFSFRPALQLMGGRLLGFAATFFVPIVLVRIFEPQAFGTYKQLFLIYGTLFSLMQIGMAESLYYFLPLKPEKSGRFLTNATLLLAASGLVAFGGLTWGASAIAGWMGNPALEEHLPWIGGYLLFMLASAGLEITMICGKSYQAASVTYAVSDLLRATLLVLPALLLEDLRWLLAGGVAFAGGRFVVQAVLMRRRFGGGPAEERGGGLRPDWKLLRSQLAYTLPFQAAVIVEVVQLNLHQYAVSYWFDAATFAIYSVGCLQIPLVDFAASSAGSVLMVGMGDSLKEGDREEAREVWLATTRKLALLIVPMVAVLLLVARDLIPFLFTAEYRASVPVFMVWTGAVLMSVLQTDAALRSFAAVRFILVMNLVRLGVIAGLIYFAVSALGLVGAVAVTVLGMAVAKGLALARLRRHLQTDWRELLPWKDLLAIGAASAAAAIPAALLRPELEPETFWTLAILGITYVAVLLPVFLASGVLREDELPHPARRVWRAMGLKPSETR